jgi:hypothetical protein
LSALPKPCLRDTGLWSWSAPMAAFDGARQ